MKKYIVIPALILWAGLILGGCCAAHVAPSANAPDAASAANAPGAPSQANAANLSASETGEKAEPPLDWAALTKLDPSRATADSKGELLWYDARDLRIEGKGWQDTETFFERFPARAKPSLTPAVRGLCANSAGICIRFASNAKKIKAVWKTGAFSMGHMAPAGIRGLDLYAKRDGHWKFAGTAVPQDALTTAVIGYFVPEMPGNPTEFMLYAPLYDRLLELKIGIPPTAQIASVPPRPAEIAKPIVFYGTSITQGGCASRTGMCHTAILGRRLNREVINLGFSGAGKMEPEIAHLLAELDPCLYVLESLPNMSADMVLERIEPCVEILRKSHPQTPILLVGNPVVAPENLGNKNLRIVYDRLKSRGVANLYFFPGEGQLQGAPGEEIGTVDGVHPTDLGFQRMANAYYPVLKSLIEVPAR